eukprot:gene11958-8232_t
MIWPLWTGWRMTPAPNPSLAAHEVLEHKERIFSMFKKKKKVAEAFPFSYLTIYFSEPQRSEGEVEGRYGPPSPCAKKMTIKKGAANVYQPVNISTTFSILLNSVAHSNRELSFCSSSFLFSFFSRVYSFLLSGCACLSLFIFRVPAATAPGSLLVQASPGTAVASHFPQMTTGPASLTAAEALCVSSYHALFLQAAHDSAQPPLASVLRFLRSIGFNGVDHVITLFRDLSSKSSPEALPSAVEAEEKPSLAEVAAEIQQQVPQWLHGVQSSLPPAGRIGTWQLTFAAVAASSVASRPPGPLPSDALAQALKDTAALHQRSGAADMPRPFPSGVEALGTLLSLPQVKAQLYASTAGLLFELETEGASSSPGSKRSRDGALERDATRDTRVFLEAQLYAATCLLGTVVAVTPLAKLLVAYIYQAAESFRPVRAAGVVSGVLQAALEVARTSMPRALGLLESAHGNSSSVSAPPLDSQRHVELVYPGPTETPLVMTNTALLLTKVVECCHQYEAEASSSTSLPEQCSEIVLRHLHELVVSLVTGCGTRHLSAVAGGRPEAWASASSVPRIVVQRGLCLAEADALVASIFPAFLQAVGYEWTWSETLRYCRAIENLPAAAPGSEQLKAATALLASSTAVSATPFPPVRWSSKLVVDTILLGCVARTYPSRLHNLLPASYDRLLEALHIELPAPPAGDDEEITEAHLRQLLLFETPGYYEAGVAAVTAYWDQVRYLDAISLDELQQVLQHSTGALPLIVQLKAIASGTSSTADELLSAQTVDALIARYRAEVLLASVIVYTQLAVPSHVQQLLRIVAPLLERYLLVYSSAVTGAPFPLFKASLTGDHGTSSTPGLPPTFVWRFSSIFQRVCGDISYQLYPLEWLPQVTDMYVQHQQWKRDAPTAASLSSSAADVMRPMHINGNPFLYSPFAAVAHQFHLRLHEGYGSSGASKNRLPRQDGTAASHVAPPYKSNPEGSALLLLDPSTSGDWSMPRANEFQRQRAERFEQLMSLVLLDMRTDSAHPQVGVTEKAFFHTFMEVKDSWLVICQSFLPSTANFTVDFQSCKARGMALAPSWSECLLLASLRWCEEVVGGALVERQLLSLREQLSREAGEALGVRLAPLTLNSATLDGSDVARRLLRAALLRLLEKTQQLQLLAQTQQEEHRIGFITAAPGAGMAVAVPFLCDGVLLPRALKSFRTSMGREKCKKFVLRSRSFQYTVGASSLHMVSPKPVHKGARLRSFHSPPHGIDYSRLVCTHAMATAAGVSPPPPLQQEGFTPTELRTAIQHRLRHSGALRQLKTQLRGMVLTDILNHRRKVEGRPDPAMTLEQFEQGRKATQDHLNNGASTSSSSPPPLSLPSTWPGRIADCLIHNHLIRSARDMSVAIFAVEAEVPPLSDTGAPADEEEFLCQLLGLPAGSGRQLKSALHMLVEEALWRRGQEGDALGHRHQCGTQTEDFDSPSDQTNPLTSMECRLAAVDAKYALTFSQMKQGGVAVSWRGEVERRMAQYKEDLHSQLRAEYQQKYRTFEQTKLHEARQQMEDHYKTLHDHHLQELEEKERTLAVKSEQDRQRVQHTREDLEQQRLRLEKKQLDMITFQQEMEAQAEKLQAQLREQRDKIQTLRFQCEKWEELCGSRLLEAESARAREMRRLEELRCAKADHATEVHVMEEEIHHLRLRLRMLTQGHGKAAAMENAEGDAATEVHPPRFNAKIPSYYAEAVPTPASYATPPDDVDAFIHRTERQQRDELARQHLAAAQRRGTATGASYSSGGDAGRPPSSLPTTAAAPGSRPSFTGTDPREMERVPGVEQSASKLESSSFIARRSSLVAEESAELSRSLTAAAPVVSAQRSGLPAATPGPFVADTAPSSNSTSPHQEGEVEPTVAVDASTICAAQHLKSQMAQKSQCSENISLLASPAKKAADPSTTSSSSSPVMEQKVVQTQPPQSASPHTSAANTSQRSDKSMSVLATAAKMLKPKSSSSSTSSTTSETPSDTSSSASKKERENRSQLIAREQALKAHLSRISSAEATERIAIDKEEEEAYKEWSAQHRSGLSEVQLNAAARQASDMPSSSSSSSSKTKSTSSSRGSSAASSSSGRPGGLSWMKTTKEAWEKKQQQEQQRETSSDSASDDILYEKSSGIHLFFPAGLSTPFIEHTSVTLTVESSDTRVDVSRYGTCAPPVKQGSSTSPILLSSTLLLCGVAAA